MNDLDDCLIISNSKIRYKLPNTKKWLISDTSNWPSIRNTLPEGTEFDFSDFEEFGKIYNSITNAKINRKIVVKLNEAVNRGDKIGILTARGDQRSVLFGLKTLLVYKNVNGKLKSIPRKQMRKKYTFAVTDPKFMKAFNVEDFTIEELKIFVLQKIFGDKMGFKKINFYDDDFNNIESVKTLKDKRITAIKI